MVNEERVKLMVKLAAYEEKEGKEDFKVSSYYRKDYASFNTLCTFIWTTIGFAFLAGLLGIAFMDQIVENLTLTKTAVLAGGAVLVYIVLVIVYCIGAGKFYKKKHNRARQRVKQYSHNLLLLNKLYEKEKRIEMDRLLEKREYILKFYTKYSKYVDKVLQFVLALLTFVFINNNVGFMKTVSNPVVTLGLAVVCAFLPMLFTIVTAVMLTLLQFYSLSLGIVSVAAIIFILMFIFYFRFTPGSAVVLLLMPIAFMLKIPVLIPIIYGLIGTPITIIPIALGTIVYYMIAYVKNYAATIEIPGKTDLLGQITAFVKQLFSNRELWVVMAAFMISLLVVYGIRRLSVDHSWKIAVVTGAFMNIIVTLIGNFVMNTHISYLFVIVGSIVSVILSIILEFFVFSVDYSRTEHLQFEDDEYYYYVKAVPKVSVATPEKTVKRINERQETAVINTDAVQTSMKKAKKKTKVSSETKVMEQADEMLLAKTLQEELDIQKIIEEELKY